MTLQIVYTALKWVVRILGFLTGDRDPGGATLPQTAPSIPRPTHPVVADKAKALKTEAAIARDAALNPGDPDAVRSHIETTTPDGRPALRFGDE